MIEIWKDISGYEGMYQVSNLGRVRSLDRIVTNKHGKSRKQKGVLLKESSSNEYNGVVLSKFGNTVNFYVHKLVATAFCEKENKHTQINHKDGDKHNNEASNLEWCTPKHNTNHAIMKLGFKPSGGTRKLTPENVSQIRSLLGNGVSKKTLSEQFGVSEYTISKIKQGRSWKKVLPALQKEQE